MSSRPTTFPVNRELLELKRHASLVRRGATALAVTAIVALTAAGALMVAAHLAEPTATIHEIHVLGVGRGGSPIDVMHEFVFALADGLLPKMIAMLAFVVGLGLGVMSQRLEPIVVGLAVGLVTSWAPSAMRDLVAPESARFEGVTHADPQALLQWSTSEWERAYYQGQIAVLAGDRAGAKAAVAKLAATAETADARRSAANPTRLYAIELVALGEAVSPGTLAYAAAARSAAARHQTHSQIALQLGGLLGTCAFVLAVVLNQLHRRVLRFSGRLT